MRAIVKQEEVVKELCHQIRGSIQSVAGVFCSNTWFLCLANNGRRVVQCIVVGEVLPTAKKAVMVGLEISLVLC